MRYGEAATAANQYFTRIDITSSEHSFGIAFETNSTHCTPFTVLLSEDTAVLQYIIKKL